MPGLGRSAAFLGFAAPLCVVAVFLGLMPVSAPAENLKGPNDQLGPDGFPADWAPSDLESPPILVAPPPSRTFVPAKKPVSLSIDQLRTVSLAPSGSVPVALPPEKAPLRKEISGTVYVPLAVAFGGASPSAPAFVPAVLPGQAAQGSLPPDTAGAIGDDLAALAAYGPLGPSNGGFSASVWGGGELPPAELAVALGRGAAMTPSPALREAWRRLLLTQALPPPETPVENPNAASAAANQSTPTGAGHWLAVRARLLQQLGLDEAAWTLWRQTGPVARSRNPELAKGWVQAGLLAGAVTEACPLAREKAAAATGDPFWPSAVAVCAAAEAQATGSGASSAALGLSLQLLPAEVQRDDPALIAALTAVRDGKPLVLGATVAGPLAGAVVASYPVLLSPTSLPLLPDVALRRLRETTTLPAELRAEVALQLAARTGWPQDGEAFLSLISGTQLQGSPARWPDAALVAWAGHAAGAKTVSSSQLVVPAALRLGDVSTALAWWPAWQGARVDEDAARARLDAEVVLAAMNRSDVPAALLKTWLDSRRLANLGEAEHAQRVLLALDALGLRIQPALWADYRARSVALTDGSDPAWRRLVDDAAEARTVPQVVGLLGEGLAGSRVADAPPATVAAAVAALKKSGLPDLARRMMAEAATLPPDAAAPVFRRPLPEAGGVSGDGSSTRPAALKKALRKPEKVADQLQSQEDGLLPPPRVKASVKAPAKPVKPTVTKPVMP